LTFESETLTVVMSDPDNLPALDDLRNFLGIKQVKAVLSSARQIEEAQKSAYAGKLESIVDLIAALEADPNSGIRGIETSIDLDDMLELAESAPVRKLINVVIRVLDRRVVSLDLEKVGIDAKLLAQFRELIHKPNGIVLVTGPTGAGKTTTLYSALNELNQITDKLITTEDPVEYEIDGIYQCPINSEIDLTFANALRSILRQDPDIILVGEIRDL